MMQVFSRPYINTQNQTYLFNKAAKIYHRTFVQKNLLQECDFFEENNMPSKVEEFTLNPPSLVNQINFPEFQTETRSTSQSSRLLMKPR